jgi:hypothetical protein
MDRIRRQDVESLLGAQDQPCVSLFLPLHPEGSDGQGQGDAILLRNLADQAEEQLINRGMRRPEARELLAEIRRLPDDNAAWQLRGKSLAAFASPGMTRVFQGNGLSERAVFVDDQFHVRLLLPQVMEGSKFFLLALSQNSVRLFEGDERELRPLDVPQLPASREDALNIDEVPRGSQVHSAMRGDQGQGKQAAVFHGQGGKADTIKDDLRLFVREVAAAVDRQLRAESAPLILATVAATVPIWQETSRYAYTLDEFVSGNPDYLTPAELHAKAWPLVEPALKAEREELYTRIHEKENPRASFGLPVVITAAMRGQVDSLFLDCSRPWWGMYDAASDTVFVHPLPQPGDADLVEMAAVETLRHGGRVFAMSAGRSDPEAAAEALLRY